MAVSMLSVAISPLLHLENKLRARYIAQLDSHARQIYLRGKLLSHTLTYFKLDPRLKIISAYYRRGFVPRQLLILRFPLEK